MIHTFSHKGIDDEYLFLYLTYSLGHLQQLYTSLNPI